jgi:multidrug resistance efflux pump
MSMPPCRSRSATVDPVAVTKTEGERSAARNPLPVGREVTGSGFVVAPDTTTVFAKYEGRITRIAVVVGDRVEAGQILVTLEDAGARFALEQASAAKVQAGLILAARDIDLAQAGIRIAEDRVAELTVRAPFVGTVTRLDAPVADTVLARTDSVHEDRKPSPR